MEPNESTVSNSFRDLARSVLDLAPQTDAMPLPMTFGDWQLVAELGRGASSVVYRGRYLPDGRPVAVKFVHSRFRGTLDRREARAMAGLDHPHIVGLLAVEMHDRGLALVMEYADGPSLRALIASGQLPMRRRFEIALALCRAVAHVHRKGLIHRDIKPSNVLTHRGRVKLADFGLVARASTEVTEFGTLPSGRTQFVGTPAYMAPEQYAGAGADRRSDVFSLAATIYELLTGRGIARAADYRALAADQVAPPLELRRALGLRAAAVWWVLRPCLAADPMQRPQSAGELSRALSAVLRPMRWAVGAAALYAIAALAGYALSAALR